jgi:hypothetical protein
MKKEEQYKIWSRVPKGDPIPRRTGRLTVGRKKNPNSIIRGWYNRPVVASVIVDLVTLHPKEYGTVKEEKCAGTQM